MEYTHKGWSHRSLLIIFKAVFSKVPVLDHLMLWWVFNDIFIHYSVWISLSLFNNNTNFWKINRLNSSFSPLTFLKLRFWPPKKKTTKPPPKFCICDSFGPQCQFRLGLRWRGTLSEVPGVFFYQKLALGAKTAIVAKLRGQFCSFYS